MITDLGIASLRGLTRLRAVSLAWNKCMTDDGLAALLLPDTSAAAARRGWGDRAQGDRAPAKRGIRELDLSCCVGLTDRACEVGRGGRAGRDGMGGRLQGRLLVCLGRFVH